MNTTTPELYVQDVTLRDGMHAIRHRHRRRRRSARSPPPSTTPASTRIEVSHGDGLAGVASTYGPGCQHRLGVDRRGGRGHRRPERRS